MISLRRPGDATLRELIALHEHAPYSYAHVGATNGVLPRDYTVDRYGATIGSGAAAFGAACDAIRDWVPFRLPWIRTVARSAPRRGAVVAVVVRLVGVWWTNLSRVVYTIDEPGRFGFAYGTLELHAETGEERFIVELDPGSGEVRYTVLAFSRPRHPLARLGYPLSRAAQRRFGAGTVAAMRTAVARRSETM